MNPETRFWLVGRITLVLGLVLAYPLARWLLLTLDPNIEFIFHLAYLVTVVLLWSFREVFDGVHELYHHWLRIQQRRLLLRRLNR